jgi:hypothetical protein
LSPTDRTTLERLVVRYRALAAGVEIQVTLLLAAVLPAGDGAIATEDQLDVLTCYTLVLDARWGPGRPA